VATGEHYSVTNALSPTIGSTLVQGGAVYAEVIWNQTSGLWTVSSIAH